ncbi:MAG: Smr/MutS family protein [Thermodesulfobacteriota bacterium]
MNHRPASPLPGGFRRPAAPAPGPSCADAQTLTVLELEPLLMAVAGLAVSDLGRERVLALRPCAETAIVERRLRRLAELRSLLSEQEPPALDGLADIRPLISRLAVDGAYLVPQELEQVADFLSAVGRAAGFLEPAWQRFGELARLANQMTPLPELARELRRIIGPGHSVASAASPELARVRGAMGRAREGLRAQLMGLVHDSGLSGVFSDQVVTQRAGRFVVPVRTDAKGRVAGIIHDTSGTGATCFVEPLSAVEGNNQLSLLARQEKEEEVRVLIQAARNLAGQAQALAENLAALAQLDCLLAQARFCDRLHSSQPTLNAQGQVELLKARHPLLAWREAGGRGRCVPIDLNLSQGARVLVISGANAGGKTVTLKTVGLITLMTMCGLHPPLDAGSRVAIYERVLAEVGDEQNLAEDLSTFTAHARRLLLMLGQAGPGTLYLIDELGNGTDPSEGSALGMAVLERLRAAGASVLVTTHFHRLKAYAALTEGVENVSVAFDQATGQPTYQLHYGAPGFSDALAVAKGLGFPPELIAQAAANLDQGERQTVALLQQAQALRQEAEALRGAASADRLNAAAELEQVRELKRAARRERSGALAEGKRRVREVSRRLEERLNQLLARGQQEQEAGGEPKPGALRQELYQARRQALAEVDQAAAPAAPEPAPGDPEAVRQLKEGDAVELASLGQKGVLLEAPKPGEDKVPVSVGVAGVRVLVSLEELTPLPAGAHTPPQCSGVFVQAAADDGLDLNLVGKTVDEALPLLDKAVDQAVLAGRPRLAVVHGVGSGRLRAAVREYLHGHPSVASLRPGERAEGGAGVTVVALRE